MALYVKLFKKLIFGVAGWGVSGRVVPQIMSGYLSLYCLLISKMCSTLALAAKNTDICLGPFGGFGGLVPPNYVKIVLFKKFLRTTKKSSALAYGAKKALFGKSSHRMKPDIF